MRGKTPWKLAVAASAIALAAAGCSSGGDEGSSGSERGGELRIYASEPDHLLVSNGDDQPSIEVVRQLYRGLVKFNKDTGAPENDLAQDISSTDNKVWTIKIKPNYKFDNGEPVNADAFIRSWNYASYGPNAQANGYFMSRIEGIDDVTSEDPDGEDGPKPAPEPKSKELSGLKKVDDLTFTVTLSAPFSGFPAVIGYSGFFPMADACVKDAKSCDEKPIGNGPYKMDGTWQRNIGITLVRSDTYGGSDKGNADKLLYRIFADVDAGYAAFQAGEIDVMYTIPPARYKEAKANYGERLFETAGNSFTYVGMPYYGATAIKDKRIRQAISMSIDRQAIIDAIFDGRFTPAQSVVAPTFDGSRDNACKYCTKNEAEAKRLFNEAMPGGWKGAPLILWANAGANHEKWLQAFGDQVKANLGIPYTLKVNLQFPEYLGTADAGIDSKPGGGFTGPFRLGWGPDYAFMETYLAPLYQSGGSSNYSGYKNPAFDALITQGDGAPSIKDAIPFYQQAEDLVLEDLPVIPMWFNKVAALYGEKVDKFVYNQITDVEYDQVTLKKA